jgi:hypothetical protein
LIVSGVSVAGCPADSGGPAPDRGLAPTEPAILSTASPAADEDPSVLRDADGWLRVAWFSERSGNADVYITRWDGERWADPARVTSHADADFAPNLYQDAAGAFHVTWFRRQTEAPYYAYVFHNRSADGVTWDPAGETRIGPTADGVDTEDWVPTITGTSDGALHIYFVSRLRGAPNFAHDIFASRSTDGGLTWSEPSALDTLNDPVQHDHLPFAARTGGGVTMVWVRHDTSADLPWENPTADVMVAQSSDGVAWDSGFDVTHDDALAVHDLFPGLFIDDDGEPYIVWLTSRSGSPEVVALRVAEAGGYPTGTVELPLEGYSPRVVATGIAGLFLGVWVAGPTGAQDVWYRFFESE